MAHQRYHPLSSGGQRDGAQNVWALPACGLLVTLAFAIALTVLNEKEWRSSENMASSVLRNRTSIAIAVQIISHVLGLIQVQTICVTIMSSFRVSLPLRPFSLDAIRLVTAASRPSVAWKTPWFHKLISLLWVTASLIPGAMWSGALTPTLAEKVTTRNIQIPTFEGNVSRIWDAGDTRATRARGFGKSDLWITDNGLFSFNPSISSIRGSFLGLASTASNTTGPKPLRQKFDQTGYHQYNRSYGVGASAGLIGIPDTTNPTWYTYREPGFLSNATCMYNETSDFNIGYITENDERFDFRFQANGSFANGQPVKPEYNQITPQRQDIFIWAVHYAQKKAYISLAVDPEAGKDAFSFQQFHKVQCEISFQPHTFTVKVNTTEKTILATQTKDENTTWPYYGHAVLSGLDYPFSHYSADESMYFGSQLGHSIVVNIRQLRLMKHMSDSTPDPNNQTMFQGLEDYLESLYDNGIAMLSATRLIGANQTTPVDATVGLPAVKWGEAMYIYTVLVISLVVLLAFVIEAVRTRTWSNMADTEFSDVVCVVLAASEGGSALADKARKVEEKEVGSVLVRARKVDRGREALEVQ